MTAMYLVQLIILLSFTKGRFTVDVLCPEEGCDTITIHLGPKWDSKVIIVSHLEGDQEPVKDTSRGNEDGPPIPPTPLHTTTTPAASRLPYTSVWRKGFQNPRPTYRSSIRNVSRPNLTQIGLGNRSVLNLTGMNVTGEELKVLLTQLTEDERLQLQVLELSHNNITGLSVFTFPLEFEEHLRELALDNNPIVSLSYNFEIFEISRLRFLKKLNLSQCGLSHVDCPYSPSLQELDLSHNRLQSLPSYLERLPLLSHLLLDGNRIISLFYLPPGNNLQYLSLSNNCLSYIDNSTLQSLNQLHELRLNNNSLEDISVVTVALEVKLHLSGNPWQCSCPLLDLVEARQTFVVDAGNLTCWSLEHAVPRLVTSLSRQHVHVGCEVRTLSSFPSQLSNILPREVNTVGVLLLVLLAVVELSVMGRRLLRLRRKNKIVPDPADTTYNTLDDKMLI